MSSPCLEARAVSVCLDGKNLLHEVSLTVRPGTFCAVLGPNGAGKSTLLRAILGYLPHRGEVLVFGENLNDLDPLNKARRLAYVPQHTLLRARLSGEEVVSMGRYAHRQSGAGGGRNIVREVMAQTDTLGLAERPFSVCSGGERARLLLARALATEARLLLMDEPVAALDLSHTLDFYDRCRELSALGYGLVMVSHDLGNAMRFTDEAILLDKGNAVARGPTSEVLVPDRIRQVFEVELLNEGPSFHRLASR